MDRLNLEDVDMTRALESGALRATEIASTIRVLESFTGGGGAAAPSVVAVTAAGATGPGFLTVDKPAGGTDGDYYVVYVQIGDYDTNYVDDNITLAVSGFSTTPDGKARAAQAIQGPGTGQTLTQWFWRKYDGTEGATFTVTGHDGSHWSGVGCFLVRGLPATWNPAVRCQASWSIGPLPIESVTIPANTLMLVGYKDWNAQAPSSRPAGWTEHLRQASMTFYSYLYTAAGPTAVDTIVASNSSTNLNFCTVLYSNPPTVFTDSFNRWDVNKYDGGTGDMSLGPNWAGADPSGSGTGAWGIVSNVAGKQAGNDYMTALDDTGSLNHWAEFVVAGYGTFDYIVVNARRPANGAVLDGYLLFLPPDNSGLTIGKSIGGGYSDVHKVPYPAVSNSYLIRIECEGNTIRSYLNDYLMDTQTDSDVDGIVRGGRYCGINANGGNIDNFRCGPLPYTPNVYGNSDTFSRYDSHANIGAPWVTVLGEPTLNTNRVIAYSSGVDNAAFYNTANFGNDHSSECVVVAGSDYSSLGPAVRMSGPLGSACTYYKYAIDNFGRVQVWRRTSDGTYTQLGSDYNSGLTTGSTVTLKLSAVGSTITGYVNGVERHSVTDTTLPTGKPGFAIFYNGSTGSLDDWVGANAAGLLPPD